MMTPREKVESALLGHWADQVPFTAYYNKLFVSQVERELRTKGLCIIDHRVPIFVVETPDVSEKTIHYRGQDGIMRMRRIMRTSKGTISEVYKQMPEHPRIPGQLLPWHEEYLFKGPKDYTPIEFMIRNRRYYPSYEAFQQAQEEAAGDVFLIPGGWYSPLLEIVYNIMGLEQFSVEWHVRRDEVMDLYQALTEDRRKFYPLVAESPALAVNYCGNVAAEVFGLDRFEEYILPHYNELAEMLHERGKLLGVHFDANTRLFASAIAKSQIDYVEAFTPFPNSDMTVAEARAAWPDKILWINFPSATHLEDSASVEEATRQILREAAPGDRFLIGVTETVPADKWQQSFSAILRVISTEGRLPLS